MYYIFYCEHLLCEILHDFFFIFILVLSSNFLECYVCLKFVLHFCLLCTLVFFLYFFFFFFYFFNLILIECYVCFKMVCKIVWFSSIVIFFYQQSWPRQMTLNKLYIYTSKVHFTQCVMTFWREYIVYSLSLLSISYLRCLSIGKLYKLSIDGP